MTRPEETRANASSSTSSEDVSTVKNLVTLSSISVAHVD